MNKFQRTCYLSALLMLIISSTSMAAFAQHQQQGNSDVVNRTLPYFASIRNDKANIRKGPATRFPIMWVYKIQGYPVEVIRKYRNWRKIRDISGDVGWVYAPLITKRRTALAIGNDDIINGYELPDQNSNIAVQIEKGSLLTINSCSRHWCMVTNNRHSGWISKKNLWGVYSAELIRE